MTVVATHNFSGIDELLARPSARAAKDVAALGQQEARMFLRHAVAELNRWYFQVWEIAQLGIGLALLLLLFLGAGVRASLLALNLLMLVAVAIQHWLLTPQIVQLGRAIDFLPPNSVSAQYNRFWGFHGTYSTMEVVKLLIGLILTVKLLVRRRRRSLESVDQIDAVDNADDGHVDGR